MGVNPYGTEGTRPPNILVGGDSNDNVPQYLGELDLMKENLNLLLW